MTLNRRCRMPNWCWLNLLAVGCVSSFCLCFDLCAEESGSEALPVAGQETGGTGGTVQRVQSIMAPSRTDWTSSPNAQTSDRQEATSSSAKEVLTETALAEDEQTRLRGLEGLAALNSAEHVDTFVAALSDSSDDVRALAGQTLAKTDAAVVADRVLAMMASEDASLPSQAESALPVLRDLIAPRLMAIAGSKEESLTRILLSVRALGLMRSIEAIPLLAELAWAQDPRVACTGVAALGTIADPEAVPVLGGLSAHPDEQVRRLAVQYLGTLEGPQVAEALGSISAAPPGDDRELSRIAVSLLGQKTAENVTPLLIEAMRRNLSVRRMAGDILRKKTGQHLGDTPSEWWEWYQKSMQPGVADQQEGLPYLIEEMPGGV